MFIYNGEAHGLRQRDNQKHWTVHQDEFFDHFLLGKPKPEWMEKGVPYLERGRRDVTDMFKPKVVTTAPGLGAGPVVRAQGQNSSSRSVGRAAALCDGGVGGIRSRGIRGDDHRARARSVWYRRAS